MTCATIRTVLLPLALATEPPLDGPALLQRGAICFRDRCMGCHGAPGQAQANAALGMQPLPGEPLAPETDVRLLVKSEREIRAFAAQLRRQS